MKEDTDPLARAQQIYFNKEVVVVGVTSVTGR